MLHLVQGKKNPGTDRHSVLSFLEQVKKAKEMMIDRFGFSTSILIGKIISVIFLFEENSFPSMRSFVCHYC